MSSGIIQTLTEREPVKFEIPTEGLSSAELRLVKHIQEVAEDSLYHWRTFPLILPPPVAVQHRDVDSSSLARRKPIIIRDLFVAPCFDELEAVALDSGGEPRKLSGKQLASVRETGEFEVESLNFTGQVHRWRLSELLQKGTERSFITYQDDLALSLRFLIITARGRIGSHFFSLRRCLKSLLRGLTLLLDVLLGFPSTKSCNLDSKLMEERCKYLVTELVCKPDQEAALEELCAYMRRQLARLRLEKYRPSEQDRPPLIYTFHTLHGLTVDLRLFNREVMRRAVPVLSAILEREARGWLAPFRERVITELKGQELSDEQIQASANRAVQDEYLRRVLDAVYASEELSQLEEGVSRLLAENAQSRVLMHRAVENVARKLDSFQRGLKHYLETHHPVKCRIPAWVRLQFREAESRFISEHQWAAHEEALTLCRESGLQQTAYFLQRDLTFMKEREPVLQKELRRVTTPTRQFEWRTHIWLWANWTVHRRFQGDSKTIPTVISQTPTSITNPRNNANEPVFILEKEVVRSTTTRWLFWRWNNFLHRLWSWGSNGLYMLGVVIPWSSPLSLRALLCVQPFTPDLELSQVNGTLCPRRSSLTPTLTSRLLSLWRHISKSRTEFETSPDTGFIGKDMTRHLNRLWNYALKGVLGTLLLVLLFPAACLAVSLTSLLLAAAVPIWVPVAVLLFHLFMVCGYDLDSPAPDRNRWCVVLEALLWNIGVLGVLQPVAAVVVGGLICPLIALILLIYGWLRWGLRRLWDRTAYDLIISRKGRIPCSDSLLVTRVHGPGLSSDYCLQIRPEQALAALEARLEADELLSFQQQTERRIQQPQQAFGQFVQRLLTPFSVQLCRDGVYGQLHAEAQQLTNTLQERIDKRLHDLQTGLTPTQRKKVKMTPRDLKLCLVAGARLLEQFYPHHVLSRLPSGGAEFWEGRGLAPADWPALCALLLTEVFSQEVLTPMEESDTRFYLEVHRVNLSRYTELLRSAAASDPPPVLAVQTAKNIQVAPPSLDVSCFSPVGRQRQTGSQSRRSTRQQLQPWKRHRHTPFTAEKLQIPLPLPHPARIAAIVYNRDTDDPVAADGPLSAAMFAALEGAEPTGQTHAENEGNAGTSRGAEAQVRREGEGDDSASSSSASAAAATAVATAASAAREDSEAEEAVAAATVAVGGAAGGRGEPHVVVIPLGDLASAAELGAGDLVSHSIRTTDV
ncbi:uncharacterized protein LOC122372479 isoform X2 [Amphibalanus amphitrite]|uniref:uncharacterized protein LOC122372479 isoform X2 n=1 Tax=Amphibalanus amphitrite TaxID=1232801 RepID=UPI001C91C98B|nr:uncharacterized protein LOC122372479 isoform X2 [Amphibalanus amphitrite]